MERGPYGARPLWSEAPMERGPYGARPLWSEASMKQDLYVRPLSKVPEQGLAV